MKLKYLFLSSVLLMASVIYAQLASPFSNSVYPAQTFTATGQTGTPIQLNGLTTPSTIGSSFASGTVSLSGSSLSTVTFSVQGSSDNGGTYYALPACSPTSPGCTTTTITATANGIYQINLAGITHVRFVTSGTFTATNIALTLTASPNATVARSGGNTNGALLAINNLDDVDNATTSRTNIGAAGSGVNDDITSLTGLTTPLPQTEGGTGNTSGNAATATQFAASPTLCSSGFAPTGIDANGNAHGCQAIGSGSGTVGSGTTGQFATYPSNGTTVTGHTLNAADVNGVGGISNNTSGTAGGLSTPLATNNGGTAVTIPFTGLRMANGASADTQATSTNVQNAIGASVFDPYGAAASTALAVSVTIAASNSTNKSFANYVATGTNDQNTINQAIAANCAIGQVPWTSAIAFTAFNIASYPTQGGPLALYNGQVWQPLQASTNVTPVAGAYWQLYTGPQIDQCTVRLLPGTYYLSGSIVFNQISDWNLVGLGHVMWGGYIQPWQGARSITGGSCTSNVCTFNSVISVVAPFTFFGFTSSGAVLNNITVTPSSFTGSTFTATVPGSGTIASTGAGSFYPSTGYIGTGGAILMATASGFPLIKQSNTPAGCGPEFARCRGYRVESIYGVCYGYTGNFFENNTGTDDNIQINDNTIQRCNHGIVGNFDSPSFSINSFQDNLGDFFHGTGASGYIKGTDNLIYDNGGWAYTVSGGRGVSITDRAWGDLLGGLQCSGCNGSSIGGFTTYNIGLSGLSSGSVANPVISLSNGFNNSIYGFTMNMGNSHGSCISITSTTGVALTGNTCSRVSATASYNDAFIVSGSNAAVTGNVLTGGAATPGVAGRAIYAYGCTNCAISGNVADGYWNFGGAPIMLPASSTASGNAATTLVNQGIATITSAYLINRMRAATATPATNGTTITAWSDSSGLGANVTAFHGTPQYTTSAINSLPAITFPGSPASWVYSTLAATSTTTFQERIVWLVAEQTTSAVTSGQQTLYSEGNASRNIYFGNQSGNNVICLFTSGGNACSAGAQAINTPMVIEVVMNGASTKIVVNGTVALSASYTQSNSAAGYSIGDKGSGGGTPFYGLVAEEAEYNGGSSSSYTTADAQTLGAAYCAAYAITCSTSW